MTPEEQAGKLYGLKLHESIDIPPELQVTRVSGGWIYRFWNISQQEYYPNAVFVPFNNEFQPKGARNNCSSCKHLDHTIFRCTLPAICNNCDLWEPKDSEK